MRVRKLQNELICFLVEVKAAVAEAGVEQVDFERCEVDVVGPGFAEIELRNGRAGLREEVRGFGPHFEPAVAQNADVVIDGQEDRELVIADWVGAKRAWGGGGGGVGLA